MSVAIRFGDKERFAVEIGECYEDSPQLRRVDMWAAGHWLTCDDNWAYVPAFCHAVQRTITRMQESRDLELPHDGLDAADTHRRLRVADDESGWRFRTLGWGPTTDNLVAMLFRLGPDRLALTFQFWREEHHDRDEAGVIFTAEVARSEFLRVLAHTVGVLSQKPVKPATLTRVEYLESALALDRYFLRRDDGRTPAWTAGRLAAQAWARLIADSAWEPSDLSRLDELVHRGARESSEAWVELTTLYHDWRNSTLASPATDPRF